MSFISQSRTRAQALTQKQPAEGTGLASLAWNNA